MDRIADTPTAPDSGADAPDTAATGTPAPGTAATVAGASGPAAPGHEAKKSPTLVLLRHGETEWSRSGQHTSVTDLPLTARGEQQARDLGAALAGHPFGLVLSSPRQRALRTAELAGYGDEAIVEPDLAEWDYGAYEGLTSVEIADARGGAWNLWDDGVPAGDTPGEDAAAVGRRADAVVARAEEVLGQGEDVLLVAHGHMLRAIAVSWLDLPPSDGDVFALWTGTLCELGFEHGRHVIVQWNSPPSGLHRP
jgi:broad specificity phosphatase PhoE